MRSYTVYVCDVCEDKFDDAKECERHEAAHYGLTHEQFKEWRQLHMDAKQTGIYVGVCKNPTTVAAFDAAIRYLVDFEERYGLVNIKRPHNWM